MYGTVYATMTTIGPMVLSTVLMLVLKFLLDRSGLTMLESRFFIASATYAFITALLSATFFTTPVSRYIADCIFLKKESDICPSAFGVLALSCSISGIVMLLLCAGVYFSDFEVSLSFLTAYYFLGVLTTAVYSMMGYSSALKHYKALTFSFFLGLLLAIGVYFLCDQWLGVPKITAACTGLACCYFLILFSLVLQCVRAFGVPKGEFFAFLSYFRKYPKLAFGGFAYMLSLYIPTFIFWFCSGIGEQVSIFRTAPTYDTSLFLAILVNTSSMVIFVVKVETAFYEKYALYVSALNNGALDLIQKERAVMVRELCHQLFFVYEIQLIITVVSVCLVSVFFPYMNASAQMLNMFVIMNLGIYTVFCMYFTIVVFYYFSDYGGAYLTCVVFLAVTAVSAIAAALVDNFYSLPLLLGGLCGWIFSFLLLRYRMENLNSFLMC